MLDRRRFLTGAAATAGLGSLAPRLPALPRAPVQDPAPKPKQFTISLAQWSFHERLFGTEEPRLAHLDFAAAARKLGIDAVEYVNVFFKSKARDEDYLREMKSRAAGEGVLSVLIMCDGEGHLGDPDQDRRLEAVENHHQWVEAAAFLGCHAIRVNAHSEGTYEEQQKLAADGLRRLCEYGDEHGISVIVENHGGLSSNGAWLAGVMKLIDHPRAGTLPDFGNFDLGDGKTYDRYRGVEELMPHAKAVSAKSYDFGEDGNETKIDYARMLRIVLAAGYHGRVGIEFEGSRLSEEEGILATKRLLERYQ